MFKRGRQWDNFVWSLPSHHMLLDIRNKNIHVYGLGVGVSVVFEILQHFLFKGGRDHHFMTCIIVACHQTLLDTRNKNVCGLRVGISMIFKRIYNYGLGQAISNRNYSANSVTDN
jgi:hypothetical protein